MRHPYPMHFKRSRPKHYTPKQSIALARKLPEAPKALKEAAEEEILECVIDTIKNIQEEQDYELANAVRQVGIEMATQWGFKTKPGLF